MEELVGLIKDRSWEKDYKEDGKKENKDGF
jgi:hypothetical protein